MLAHAVASATLSLANTIAEIPRAASRAAASFTRAACRADEAAAKVTKKANALPGMAHAVTEAVDAAGARIDYTIVDAGDLLRARLKDDCVRAADSIASRLDATTRESAAAAEAAEASLRSSAAVAKEVAAAAATTEQAAASVAATSQAAAAAAEAAASTIAEVSDRCCAAMARAADAILAAGAAAPRGDSGGRRRGGPRRGAPAPPPPPSSTDSDGSDSSDDSGDDGDGDGSRSSGGEGDTPSPPPPRLPPGWIPRPGQATLGQAVYYAQTARFPRLPPADPTTIPEGVGVWDLRGGVWVTDPTSWGAVARTAAGAIPLRRACPCGSPQEGMNQARWNLHHASDRDAWVRAGHIVPAHAPVAQHLCPLDGWRWKASRGCACRRAAIARGTAAPPATRPGSLGEWEALAPDVHKLPLPRAAIPLPDAAPVAMALAVATAAPIAEVAIRAFCGVVLAAGDMRVAAAAFSADAIKATTEALAAAVAAAALAPSAARAPVPRAGRDPMRGVVAALKQGDLAGASRRLETAGSDRPPPQLEPLRAGFRQEGVAPDLTRVAPPKPQETEEPSRAEVAAARAALRRVKATSAAGPDRLTGRHLHRLIRCGDPTATEALTLAFIKYSRAFASGARHSDDPTIRGQLPAVRLCPVPKGSQDWRPVVVPSLVSRVAGSALARDATGAAAPRLRAADQFAVGLSSGAEIMVRGVVEALRAGRAVAITDRSHAYQSADRGKLLEGLQSMGANSTSAAFAARYSDGVPITGLDITATQGVVQGDPLAPLSFGSLQAAQTRRLQADPSLAPLFDNGARILSYLDDIVLVAPDADGLERLVEALEKDDAGIGLKLNNAKCAANVPIRDWRNFASEGGAVVLGIAVGSDDFIRRHAAATLEKAAKVEKKILEASLPDHDRFVMIAKCGVHARLVHTLRSTPPRLLDQVCTRQTWGRARRWPS